MYLIHLLRLIVHMGTVKALRRPAASKRVWFMPFNPVLQEHQDFLSYCVEINNLRIWVAYDHKSLFTAHVSWWPGFDSSPEVFSS